MLPEGKPLDSEQIQQIAKDYKRFEKTYDISRDDAAKTLGEGFSATTLSEFLNRRYRGDNDRIARGLNEYMERHVRSLEVRLPQGFVITSVAKRMLTVVRHAVEASVMGTIVGPAGVGKTLTMQAAAKLYTGSIYMRITQSRKRGPGFARELARLIGAPYHKSLERTERILYDALTDSNRPLFIDEAHELSDSALAVVRDIYDVAGLPIVLCGTKKLTNNVDDAELFFGQFASRIGPRFDATELALRPRNPQPLYSVDEILKIFGSGKLRLTDDGAQFLTELACLPGQGSLRLCAQLVRIATRLSSLPNGAADAATFRGILREFHGVAHSISTKARMERADIRVAAG